MCCLPTGSGKTALAVFAAWQALMRGGFSTIQKGPSKSSQCCAFLIIMKWIDCGISKEGMFFDISVFYLLQNDYVEIWYISISSHTHTHIWQSIVGDTRCGKVFCTVMVHGVSELFCFWRLYRFRKSWPPKVTVGPHQLLIFQMRCVYIYIHIYIMIYIYIYMYMCVCSISPWLARELDWEKIYESFTRRIEGV